MLFIEKLDNSYRVILSLTAAVLLLIVVIIFVRKNSAADGSRAGFKAAAVFTAAVAGGLLISLGFHAAPAWSGLPIDSVRTVRGIAAADSRRLSSGSYILEMELERAGDGKGGEADAGGRLLLFFPTDPELYRGCRFSADTGLTASDDYRALMLRQRAGGSSLLMELPVLYGRPSEGSIVRTGWSSALAERRAELAAGIIERCSRLAGGSGGLFAALFTGRRDGLSAEESRVFREAGCSHILALSGMHLAILSGIILLLLKPLPGRKASFLISCVLIFAYLYLTGFGVSLVRAAVMYFIGGTAAACCRRFRGIDVLLLSFIVLIVIEPSSFYTISFQLSFLAVAGILIASPVLSRLMRPFLPAWLAAALACSIGAQLFVTPLLLQVFGGLYPVGLFAGLLMAPMVTVFIWIGILYLITGFGIVSTASGLLYRAIFFTAEKAADFPSVKAEDAGAVAVFICAAIAVGLVIYSIYRRRIDGISG